MKKFISLLLTLALVFSSFGVLAYENSGTQENPVLIYDKWDLLKFADDINGKIGGGEGAYYKLANDIDLGGMNWSVYIGTDVNPFRGTFDGNGKEISNFRITVETYLSDGDNGEDYYGLFGAMAGDAKVYNLGINNVEIHSSANVWNEVAGGIVGIMYDNAKIDGCYAKNFTLFDETSPELSGSAPIAGRLDGDGVEVTNCYSLNVKYPSSGADHESGIAGRCENFAKIENCYSTFVVARAKIDSGDKIINTYFSGDAPWPWENGDGATKYFGTKLGENELKQNVDNLGSSFKDGGKGNGGYPALLWEEFDQVSSGGGTEDDPILISNADDLASVAGYADTEGMFFKMTADIDMKNADWDNYIGTSENPFKGTFDGDGHIIKNVRMKNEGKSNIGYGIFGYVDNDAVIKNVGVENIYVYQATNGIYYSQSAFGGLVGFLKGNATVQNCYSKDVSIDTKTPDKNVWSGFYGDQVTFAGGLIGTTVGGNCSVENCYSLSFKEIDDSASSEGGLVGSMPEGSFKEIKNCYSNTNLSASNPNDASKIKNCYATDTTSWSAYGARPGINVTDEQLKTKATDLGEAFKDNNSSYPILVWETETNENVAGGNVELVAMKGSGTKADPYVIECAGNIIAASQVANTDGVYFVLANDINFGGNILPAVIGSESNPFKGHFNGNGHIIKNFKLDINADGDYGIFGVVAGDAFITNFGVEDVNIVLSSTVAWNTRAGGIAAYVKDNATITNSYAKYVKFSATFVRDSQAEIRFGGGLFGEINGSGVVIKNCYSKGYEEVYEGSAIVNNDGGFAGSGLDFKVIENCYSDTSLLKHLAKLNVVNCFEKNNFIEWPDGYDWGAVNSHPNALNYKFSNEFLPVMGGSPRLKWEVYKGMYINLVDFNDIKETTTSVSSDVTLEKGSVYRVSFRGMTASGNDAEFIWKLGDVDLADKLINKTVGDWSTKALYVKAEEDGVHNFTLSCEEEMFVEDVEIIKVDAETELTGIHQSFYHKVPRNPIVDFDLLVPQTVYDGVEIKYTSSNGYISQTGKLDLPIGYGTTADTYSALVEIADLSFAKDMVLTLREKAPVEIKKVTMTSGNKEVWDVSKADIIEAIEIAKNENLTAQMFIALYKDDALKSIKKVNVADETEYEINMPVNDADKYKVFVYADGSLMPISLGGQSYPTLKGEVVKVHPTGDSLCETYSPDNERTGWGQVFVDYFNDGTVEIDNTLSRSGMSTVEYVEMGRLNKLMNKLLPDEYVLIQLGTNDQWIATKEQYINYLTQIVSVVRAKNAIPVFINPPDFLNAATNTKNGDKYVVNSQLCGYPDVMREMAVKLNVPMIDVNQKTLDYFAERGHAGAVADGYYLTDNVHFNEKGARWIAGLVAEGLTELGIPLAQYLK